MTEEDTFKRLRRIPFMQMYRIWADSPMTLSTPGFRELFDEYGWEWEDYLAIHHETFK